MKLKSIILSVLIALFVLVLLVATDVIRISYCNNSLGIPCKGVPDSAPQNNNTNETSVSQTTIPPATIDGQTRPENQNNEGEGAIDYLPGQCPAIEDIKKEIEEANYCSVDTDCRVTFFGCPFGCGGYVNAETDIPALKARITRYNECINDNCTNNCVPVPEPMCADNKCTEDIRSFM